MQNPWDADEIISPAQPTAQQTLGSSESVRYSTQWDDVPWEQDEVVSSAEDAGIYGDGEMGSGPLEIDIIGGTPESEAAQSGMRAPLPVRVGDEAKSLFRADSDVDLHAGQKLVAAAKDMFGSQKGVAEYAAEKLGGRVVRTSDGGYGVIGQDGKEYRVNDEGLDSTDIGNVAGNIAAAFLPAAWAGKAAQARSLGTAGRMGLQGAVAGGQDAAMHAAVSGGEVDLGRAGISALGGGLGELAGTGLSSAGSKLGQMARVRSGQNQQSALATLADAGISEPPPTMLAQLAQQSEQIRLGADPRAALGNAEFGFQYTQGQRLTDAARKQAQLSQEEVLRQSPGGAAVFDRLYQGNLARLSEAVDGIGGRLGGQPMASPGELVQGSAGRLRQQADELKAQVDEAYAGVRGADTVAVSRDTVSSVPARLQGAVRDFDINPATTPGAYRALEQVRLATGHILGGENVRGVTLRALETQRRILGNAVGSASNPADRAALMAIRREFDGWMDEAIDTALVSGDPAALAQLKEARALRAEFGRRFEGGKDADKFITGMLDGSRTPEELMNIALGASQVSKSAAARFIARLRTAANDDPAVMGGLRAAHFARLTRGNNGETLAPGQIVRNIRSTEYNNASVAKALYTDAEWAEIRRLANALEPMVAKGDFARTSGTAERLQRMLFQRIGGSLPFVGETVQAVGGVRDSIRASRAVNGQLVPYNQGIPGLTATSNAAGEEWLGD